MCRRVARHQWEGTRKEPESHWPLAIILSSLSGEEHRVHILALLCVSCGLGDNSQTRRRPHVPWLAMECCMFFSLLPARQISVCEHARVWGVCACPCLLEVWDIHLTGEKKKEGRPIMINHKKTVRRRRRKMNKRERTRANHAYIVSALHPHRKL